MNPEVEAPVSTRHALAMREPCSRHTRAISTARLNDLSLQGMVAAMVAGMLDEMLNGTLDRMLDRMFHRTHDGRLDGIPLNARQNVRWNGATIDGTSDGVMKCLMLRSMDGAGVFECSIQSLP